MWQKNKKNRKPSGKISFSTNKIMRERLSMKLLANKSRRPHSPYGKGNRAFEQEI